MENLNINLGDLTDLVKENPTIAALVLFSATFVTILKTRVGG